jgi:hypothetical protein
MARDEEQKMSGVILMIWTVVAGDPYRVYRDWRPLGEFRSEQSCLQAAAQLKLMADQFKCLQK